MWSATSTSANINHNFSESINVQGSRWPPALGLNNEFIQPYGFPQQLAHACPTFLRTRHVGPSSEFSSVMSGVPNVGSSSSSSCRVSGGSPNSIFGSFSSSIGTQDMTPYCPWLGKLEAGPTTTSNSLEAWHSNNSMSVLSSRKMSDKRFRLANTRRVQHSQRCWIS